MRLFVGVEVDPVVAAAAGALVDELRHRVAQLVPKSRVTWMPRDRLHLTVRFIGNVSDDTTTAIHRALSAPLAVSPFALSLAGVGAFPRTGKPQVLWAGVAAGQGSLEQIEREVSGRLEAVGVPPEDRPYRPHLTLARVREAAGLKSPPLLAGLEDTSLGTSRVEATTLFESQLSPRGSTYVPLQRTMLRAWNTSSP